MLKRALTAAVVSVALLTNVLGATSFGALSITSDPDGAMVFVDGSLAGLTPLALDQLAVGEHRVRIAKPGYLDNGRVVSVTSGAKSNLTVKLTVDTNYKATSAATAPGDGGLLKNKWFWVAVAGGGGAAAYFLLKEDNKAPSSGTISASTSTALQGANVTFTASGASDPNGDSLSYAWNFGDGQTGSGATATHLYTSAGTFTVTMTVSDGKLSAPAASTTITVRNLTATWTGPLTQAGIPAFNTRVVLTQNGVNLSGTYTDQFPGTGSVVGTVAAGGTVSFSVKIPNIIPWSFSGTAAASLNTLNGVGNGSGFVNATWTLNR